MVVGEGLPVVALTLLQPAEIEVDAGLAGVVADLGKRLEGTEQVIAGVVMAVEPDVGTAEAVVGAGLPGPVGRALRGAQRTGMDRDLVRPAAAPVKVGGQGPRELPGVPV